MNFLAAVILLIYTFLRILRKYQESTFAREDKNWLSQKQTLEPKESRKIRSTNAESWTYLGLFCFFNMNQVKIWLYFKVQIPSY